MRARLERGRGLCAVDADDGIVSGVPADRDARVRQVRQPDQHCVARGFGLCGRLVERGDAVAEFAGLLLAGLGFLEFLLAHERANFLGRLVAQRLEVFDFDKQLATAFVVREDLVESCLIAAAPRGETLADEVWFFADQFDVEHAEVLVPRSGNANGRVP